MSDAMPMPGEALAVDDVDLHKGFTWTHGNYSKKNAGMEPRDCHSYSNLSAVSQTQTHHSILSAAVQLLLEVCRACHAQQKKALVQGTASRGLSSMCTERAGRLKLSLACSLVAGMTAIRQFVPPNNLRVVYDKGFVKGFATMGVPVRPGVSRVFGRFVFGAPGGKTPPLLKLLGKMPHWVRVSQSPLADQDSVINAKQVSAWPTLVAVHCVFQIVQALGSCMTEEHACCALLSLWPLHVCSGAQKQHQLRSTVSYLLQCPVHHAATLLLWPEVLVLVPVVVPAVGRFCC